MGYYIPGPATGKAQFVKSLGGEVINRPEKYSQIPKDKALIVVVENGNFEAAGFAYSEREFDAWMGTEDPRPMTFMTMDRSKAEQMSGFPKK